MRVLFITNTFPPAYTGGAEVANYHTCRGLIRRGVDCSILVLNNRVSDWPDAWYEVDGIPVHRVGHMLARSAITDVFDPWIYRLTKSQLLRLRPDVVHIHNVSGATLAPYLACRAVGIPVVNTLHDQWLLCPNNMLYRGDGTCCDPRLNPRGCSDCFRRYDFWGNIPNRRTVFAALTSNVKVFVSPSQDLVQLHVQAGYEAGRFRVVRHGLIGDVQDQITDPGLEEVVATRARYGTVAFAGGGVEIKGAAVLLDAIPSVLSRMDHVRLIVAGGGEGRFITEFRAYTPRVQVLGPLPFRETRFLFAASDLVVVPSTWHESFSLVTLESLQAGTPVVGSNLGGIPELIQDGYTGYLVPAGDANALADCIVMHLERPAIERRRMRRHCVEDIRSRLKPEEHVEGVLQVYREVLGR